METIDIRKIGKDIPADLRKRILSRPVMDTARLESKVSEILQGVRTRGDEAVRKFSRLYDRSDPEHLLVDEEEMAAASKAVSSELKAAIRLAATNIETFHRSQVMHSERVETMPGVACWRKSVAIEKVGLYIPGGTAPLFSTLLMLGIPAKIAGCRHILLCTPPSRDGQVHPAILYAAGLVGVTRIYKAGGVQAIGAMAYGTETIPAVYKIFGPGNQYVTCAKKLVQQEGIAIDMPAGPSEVAIFADQTANPVFVAADLLSQAEHGIDSQVFLVTDSESVSIAVQEELARQLHQLPRKDVAEKALAGSRILLVNDRKEAIALLNEYAPEHLILACSDPAETAEGVINAGSVFLGHFTPESAGDYASGTNHTLPTNGFARSYSGVSVDSFVKKITFQQLSLSGLQSIGTAITQMAEAEGLEGHAHAVRVRLDPQAGAGQ
jgi:histidinol dehydrogenase